MSLTVKQEKFVQALFKGLTQRQAYKEAYNCLNMKEATMDNNAYMLTLKSEIKARLQELQDNHAKESGWTLEKIIKEFEEIKDMCKVAKPVLTPTGDPTGEYRFDSSGAVKSLENIGKLLGMYEDKIKHSGSIEMPSIIIGK